MINTQDSLIDLKHATSRCHEFVNQQRVALEGFPECTKRQVFGGESAMLESAPTSIAKVATWRRVVAIHPRQRLECRQRSSDERVSSVTAMLASMTWLDLHAYQPCNNDPDASDHTGSG